MITIHQPMDNKCQNNIHSRQRELENSEIATFLFLPSILFLEG